ncbi:MAG: hypothetical protein ABMA01_19570 [Chthoniobacteraceae bacterium]
MKLRLYICGAAILVLGLCGALLIYFNADEAPADAIGYLIVDGVAYPTAGTRSKTYVRDLERFGGKAAVLFDEFNRWFAGLWRGKALASTVAWISVIVSLGLFLFARWLPPDRGDSTT